jgi:hypothetical protein
MDNEGTVCDTACCPVGEPCIDVTKRVNCEPSKWGDDVIYRICVINCGDVPLYDIEVSDDVIPNVETYFPAGSLDELAPGDSTCADVTYTIPEGAPDPVVNEFTATGYTVSGDPVSDNVTETVDLIHPAITIDGICLTEPVAPGGTAEYEFTATNTGDCILVTDAPVTDPVLDPGEFATWTETEVDPGGVTEICHVGCVTWTLPPEYCEMDNEGTVCDTVCCPVAGEDGCTPGFWKNHPDCWCEDYDPDQSLGSVFTIPAGLSDYATDSLMDGLNYGGGGGVEGAARNLFRSAVSALLNACNDNVNYPLSVALVISRVNAALATMNRSDILALHAELDMYNNYGCTIDAHCRPHGDEDSSPDKLGEAHTGEILPPEEQRTGAIPTEAWSRSVPNPFGETTTIQFGLPKGGPVSVDVFDVTGRLVTSLLSAEKSAGVHQVVWNGRSADDTPVPAGVYFYRINLEDEVLMRKMMLVR